DDLSEQRGAAWHDHVDCLRAYVAGISGGLGLRTDLTRSKPACTSRKWIALFRRAGAGVSSPSLPVWNNRQRPRMAFGEEAGMHGLIAAAGLGTRLQDLGEKRNKVLLDLGGETILGTILQRFEQAGIRPILVAAGFDAPAVRTACNNRATCILNPF